MNQPESENPYLPAAATPAEAPYAPRWLICGLPLLLVSGIFQLEEWSSPESVGVSVALSVTYAIVAVLLATNNGFVKRLAVLLWLPLLAAIPIGTIIGIVAIRELLRNKEAEQAVREETAQLSEEELEQLVLKLANEDLGVQSHQRALSLRGALNVAPIELSNFLDDLRMRHDLPICGDEDKRVQTLDDLLTLLKQRRYEDQ